MNRKPFSAYDGPCLMLVAIVAMLVGQFVITLVILGVGGLVGEGSVAYEVVNFLGTFLFECIYLAAFLVYTKKRNISCDYNPLKKTNVTSAVAAPLLALVCLFSYMGLAALFSGLLSKIGFTDMSGGFISTTPFTLIMVIIDTVIAAPICEELIFRVGLLSGMNKTNASTLKMCLISGICFALMHMNPTQTVYQFFLGAVMAYVVIKTGSALTSMIMHATNNAFALILMNTNFGTAIDGFYAQVDSNVLIALLCCVLLPAVGTVVIWLVSKYLNKAERKNHPQKFTARKVVWIDENTNEPIFEGEEAPVITEENRTMVRGYNSRTGEPIVVDRVELQQALMKNYLAGNERTGKYKQAFIIYFCLTTVMWLFMLGSGILSGAIM